LDTLFAIEPCYQVCINGSSIVVAEHLFPLTVSSSSSLCRVVMVVLQKSEIAFTLFEAAPGFMLISGIWHAPGFASSLQC
jgi:hypothetical protein